MTLILLLQNGSQDSDQISAAVLRATFGPWVDVKVLNLDPDPAQARDTISNLLIDHTKDFTNWPVLIGSSGLSGFYANYFAHTWDLHCILVDPTFSPATSFNVEPASDTDLFTMVAHSDSLQEMIVSTDDDSYNGACVNLFAHEDNRYHRSWIYTGSKKLFAPGTADSTVWTAVASHAMRLQPGEVGIPMFPAAK
jgi:predicted esterase YcpF (UPF0227 family)